MATSLNDKIWANLRGGPSEASSSSLPQHNTASESIKANERMAKRMSNGGEEAGSSVPRPAFLPMPIKRRIVELLATFQTHKAVRDIIKDEFGTVLSYRQIAYYDPARGSKLSNALKDLYTAVRAAYIEQTTDVAIAHQAHRLRQLEVIVEKAIVSKDFNAATKALELAAKEIGGALTGKTEVVHKGVVSHVHGSIEDARQEVAMRLNQLVEQHALPAPEQPQVPDNKEE